MSLAGFILAAQLSVTVHAPDSVTVGAPAAVTVEATASGARTPRIIAPVGSGFSLVLTGAASRISPSIGSRWHTVEQRYELVARRAGALVLPPFEATAGAATARSKPRRIAARPAPPPGTGTPTLVTRAQLDPREGVLLRAAVAPETVYVGEQATYQVAVFLDDDVRLRLRRNPEFVPPEPRGMLAYELQTPRSTAQTRVVGGKRYEAHVFQRGIFPLSAGRYVIPQAQLVYSIPLSASFFSREESRTVRADSVVVVALEPPAAGRPADWLGAVGDLAVGTRLDSSTGRAGDPMVVTLRVAGRGNVKLLPRPTFSVPWGTAVPTAERVQLDSASTVVKGAKEFDWLVTPRDSGTLELPAIRYPFFNPYTEAYEIAVTAPRTLTIAPGVLAALDTSAAAADLPPPLALRRVFRPPVGPPAHESPLFLAAALLAPIPAAALGLLRRRPRRRRAVAVAPHVALRALVRGRREPDAARLRRVYVAALAARLDLTPGVITTTRGALSHALRRAGVTPESAHAAEALLVALDRAAYSPGAPSPAGAAREALDLYARVDAEARSRLALAARVSGGVRRATTLLLALSLGALSAAHGAGEEPAARLFARGAAAYDARDFRAAANAYGVLAARLPRAADAWANFGTASWQAADTAAATVGWQRALRLEPLAADVRERLDLVGASQRGPIASVPPLPLDALTLATLGLWCLAWGALSAAAVRPRRARRLSRWSAALVAASVVGAAASRDVAGRLSARSLAVVEGHAPLQTLPALAAERGASLSPGDVARVLRREGVWARIALDGDRDGWVEWDRLTPLAP